jgi:putative transposase
LFRQEARPCIVREMLSPNGSDPLNKFFKKLLKGQQYVPRVIITGQLKSYAAVKGEVMAGVEHRQSRSFNNRCENSHRPPREGE